MTKLHHTFQILIGTNIALGAWILWEHFNVDLRPPISEWHRVEVLNSPIKAGEDLQVRIVRNKVRDDCPVASDRQAINSDGKPVDLADVVWLGGSSDNAYLDYTYTTPRDMIADNYILRVYLTYTCPDFVWTTQQPDARFRVID